jgi:3-deoxy-D-manno-octulosonic acid (KDO) 8-phosphate synthase
LLAKNNNNAAVNIAQGIFMTPEEIQKNLAKLYFGKNYEVAISVLPYFLAQIGGGQFERKK